MKRLILATTIAFMATFLNAQTQDSTSNYYQNTAEQFISNNGKLNIGGYGEVHFNQPYDKDVSQLGTVDVHRIVMFLGYNFNAKTQFVTEIEFEHADELWVEQAFLQHKLHKYVNLRAGLLLVPMGIINEYHEPTTFNGVERPTIDSKLSPSTWREIGFGLSGTILPVSLKYQAYLMSGLYGYDTKGVFSGSNGIRNGRQKGAKAYVTSPAFAGKVEYFGIKNLNVGISGYVGKSQSKLFSKLHNDSTALIAQADSSVVGISMIGADFRYAIKGIELRGQLYFTNISNTEQYNVFTQVDNQNNNLGSQMLGYYAEVGYDVLRKINNNELELKPFVRYEFYNMHHAVSNTTTQNDALKTTQITTGLTFKLNKHACLKSDIQFTKSEASSEWSKIINAGIGVTF